MRKFRLGVFETNSSSNHTLILMLADDYEKFSKGKLYYDTDTCKLISLDEGHSILEQIANEKGIPIHDLHSKFQTRLYSYRDLTLGDARLNYDSMQVGDTEVIAMTVEPRLHGVFERKKPNY